MSPDKSLQNLFNAALEQSDAAERARFLDEACGADAVLRERVEKLLRAQEEVGAFMAQPSRKPAGLDLNQTGRVVIPLTEKPGDLIGRYKLLQQIGEGGCGVVYMAEQEKPVRRRVALKVIKLGMDTKQVIARFEAERQALALMDHPNIARVLDVGATDTGRPYFVMELVRGTKITEFCDQKELPTQERLDLFLQVCSAVQHAHQKGIIHRDIKPSNILVTVIDGMPVPKVIDFGIAKATNNQPLTDKTVFTAFEQFIGTPAYMSPEQAELSGVDIDTRTDIYSLGVVLYELLTGSPPFDQKELLSAGLDEMRRTIREVEPAKPSTRLTQALVAADVSPLKSHPESARNVRADSRRLLQEVKGDLDWIAMKCLEKDRARRYETANALAADIRRHLASEPVVARPPSRWYEFQKTVRRHKFGFAAATALVLVLMLGVVISTWQAIRAGRAEIEQSRLRQAAEAGERRSILAAAQSEQTSRFLKDMLNGVGPSVALGRDTTMLQEILDKTAARVGEELKDLPLVEADLRNTLGDVYFALRELEKAETMHRTALALRRIELGDEHPDVAASLDSLALDRALQGDRHPSEASNLAREALAIRRKSFGNVHPAVALSLNHLARTLQWNTNDLHEIEALYREGLAICRLLYTNDHPSVAVAMSDLSLALRARSKLAEAETLNGEALAMLRRLHGEEHPDVADSLGNYSRLLLAQGKLNEAETVRLENLAMRKKLVGDQNPLVSDSYFFLAQIFRAKGDLNEAASALRKAVKISAGTFGEAHPKTATLRNTLADMLRQAGMPAEAGDNAADSPP